MRKEIKTNTFGSTYELRTEANGHSASNASGCVCRECQEFRIADGRCPECGRDMKNAGNLILCVGCTANGLGA